MQVFSVNSAMSFGQWKSRNNSERFFYELIKEKNIKEIQNLNPEYSEYGSDECSLLFGKMYNELKSSLNTYDYNSKNKKLEKFDAQKNRYVNIHPNGESLVSSLYKEYFNLVNSNKKK